MSKKLYILAVMSALILSGCSQEYYINDGCTVGATYCKAGVYYECVNSKLESLNLDKIEFVDPVFETDNLHAKDDNSFWLMIDTCKTSCDANGTKCQFENECKNGENKNGSCTCICVENSICNADGSCTCSKECVNGCNDDGSCKPLEGCQNGVNDNGTCRCPNECENGCTELGVCKQRTDCANGYKNEDGTCRCPDKCKDGCDEIGAICTCPEKCVNGCNDDGTCKPVEGCQNGANDDGTCLCPAECENGCTEFGACKQRLDCVNGYNDDGTCKCPDKCTDGCDEKGDICLCPTACPQHCNDTGAECTCLADCVVGCDVNTGICKCTDKCTAGCDDRGTCDAECEGVICQGVNDECQKGECVDLCKDITCEKANEYCKKGKCVFWDGNGNHLHDMYETAAKKDNSCRKHSDCDTNPGDGDGFCDSFLGYKCSTRCKTHSECVNDGEFDYVCRNDGRCAPDTFVTVWKIPNDNRLLRIPTSMADAYSFDIDWGDGSKSEGCSNKTENNDNGPIECKKLDSKTTIDNGDLLHEYQELGSYTVKIKGQYDGWGWPYQDPFGTGMYMYPYLFADNSPVKLFEVKAFGPVGLKSFAFAFQQDAFSSFSKIDIPDASKMQDMSFAFFRSGLSFSIEKWDMSYVTDMRGMFMSGNFNQPLDHWDTSSVKWMGNKGSGNPEGVFANNGAFNQPLENWDTSNVMSMSHLFYYASAFDQSIGNWNTSKVMYMHGTFMNASAFNQPLENWDTSSVTDMGVMFKDAEKFNQSLNKWNTSKVISMSGMFLGAISFNGKIGNWDTHLVTDMSSMFQGAESFNQSINYLDGTVWQISQVTNMHSMFNGAISFNQSLDKWTPGYVEDMGHMFDGATSFDQDLSSWVFNCFVFKPECKPDVDQIFNDTKLVKDSPDIYCKIFKAWKGKVQATTCSDLGMAGCSCE